MSSLHRVLLLSLGVAMAAAHAGAQSCPRIPNFRISHSTSSYTLMWDAPPGVASPVYEVMQATRPLYCPLPDVSTTWVPVATTAARTITVPKPASNTTYFAYVRVQGNTCVDTGGYYGADTFTQMPQAPVITSGKLIIGFAGNLVQVTFNQSDPRTVSLWLYRADDQKFITSRSSCGSDPKTMTDPAPLQNGTSHYQVIAFNTGNAAGLNGVASNVVNVAVGGAQQQPPPDIVFSASPTAIRAGLQATLSWRVVGATSVTIDQGVGVQNSAGAVTVTLSQTTTYTLTATNGAQSSTASVTVFVSTAPQVVVSGWPAALVQTAGTAGATATYSLTNIGGSATSIRLTQAGQFFTQSPDSFTLVPGATQKITIMATQQAAGTYEGLGIPSGPGVPAGMEVRLKLLSASVPSRPVAATPASNRVDVSGLSGESPAGTVTFSNSGAATLSGMLVSDVPWIVPQSGTVAIPAQSSATFTFAIDRSKRPDSDSLAGSQSGNMSLVYVSGTGANSGVVVQETPAPSASLVTVVDTIKLTPTNGPPPPLAAGDIAIFIPGVGHVQGSVGLFVSDISVINPSGNRRVDDLRLYYTPLSTSGSVQKTAVVPPLAASSGVAFADVVKSVFGNDGQVGSLQIRSAIADKLSISTNVFNSSNPAGTYGTAIPTMRSDRAVAPGAKLVLTGLRADATAHTNLYLQETAGANATVTTEFLAADGSTLGARSDALSPFGVAQVNSVVPQGAVSAVMTNSAASSGRFLAFATPVDDRSGDTWAVADWSRQYGYSQSDPVVIPVSGTLRGANNTFFRTDVSIMNNGSATATATLRFVSAAAVTSERLVTIGARQTTTLSDVIGALFGLSSTSGYLIVTPAGGATFAVTSRTYATVGNDPATYGTHVPVLATAAAMKLGALRTIGAIEDSSLATVVSKRPATFRTNFGLLETSGNPVKVRVTLRFNYAAGTKVSAVGTAMKDYDLAANQFLQVNGMTAEIIGSNRESIGDLRGVQADFQVISGSGALTIFTSSTDNGTADSILRTE